MTSYHGNLHTVAFRFYDQVVLIQSDSNTVFAGFSQMYARFQIEPVAPHLASAVYTILTTAENHWNSAVLLLDDAVHRLDDPHEQQGYLYETILFDIMRRVRSHFLLHAGVVSRDDQGVLLVADSCHGKTTLTLELIRWGFQFLSDEIAAVGRADGLVYPFPRRLRIRPGTLELTGFARAAQGAPMWLDKFILDIEALQPGVLGEAVPVQHVVILTDPHAGPLLTGRAPTRELGLRVDCLHDPLLLAIRGLEGVAAVHVDTTLQYPLLWIHTLDRSRVLSQVEALCRTHNVWLLDTIKRVESRPTFTSPARILPISKREAVLELLGRFQGGYRSALLQSELDGRVSHLVMALTAALGSALCYRLFVGPLSQMADSICQLVQPRDDPSSLGAGERGTCRTASLTSIN